MTALLPLYFALGFWAVGVCLALAAGRRAGNILYSALLFAGSVSLVLASAAGAGMDVFLQGPEPIYFAVAPLLNRVDSLACLFLGLLGAVGAAAAAFSPGYLAHLKDRINIGSYWACLFLFMLAMAEVVLSANAVTFLVFWEVMSLSSVALVAADQANKKAPQAALIYLGATRVATAFLAGGFLWLHALTGSWSFSDWRLSGEPYFWASVLIFLGLMIKAGVWPFHLWLPYAHPAAPTPVSALMSGVMIKIAIYALVRLLVLGEAVSGPFLYVVLVMGTVSAFWGVLFALTQRDLKRLLAYSSIENVGLILMGISVCLYCKVSGLPEVAAIALAAALFHCINHGLFKSALFLGAGAVDAGAGTRDLEQLGGLAGRMRYTTACFLASSLALCALPPFNGFASKWLLYQSLFRLASLPGSPVTHALALACIGVLALVGGLAVACFTRAVGIGFLGRPRAHFVERAHEGTSGMIFSQLLLASSCLVLGVAAGPALKAFQPVCAAVARVPTDVSSAFTVPMTMIFVVLLAFVLAPVLLVLEPAAARKYKTWECGYGELSSRAQATAQSFAQPIEHIFSPVLQYTMMLKITGKDRRHFPEHVKVESSFVSLLESRIYLPAINAIEWASKRLAAIQAGSIHLYLLYMLMTLILLVSAGAQL
ncbi:MAG TPA: proton-conducting transporter membrane subunit [Candidatus Obscuribacterales bacterium]